MTAPATLTYLGIGAIVATMAIARVASLPELTKEIATACDGASFARPAVGQIDKLIGDYTRHRAGVVTALSGCR